MVDSSPTRSRKRPSFHSGDYLNAISCFLPSASSSHIEYRSFCISALFASRMTEPETHPPNAMRDLKETEKISDTDGRHETTQRSLDDVLVQKPAENSWMDPKAFPEGGAEAWLTVAGSSACLFVSFGWVNCVGVFQEYYQTHQLKEYSASDVAWIPALQRMRRFLFDHLARLSLLTSKQSFLCCLADPLSARFSMTTALITSYSLVASYTSSV